MNKPVVCFLGTLIVDFCSEVKNLFATDLLPIYICNHKVACKDDSQTNYNRYDIRRNFAFPF
jgi:hypothetical protein